MRIGYYVHHHGAGHAARACSVAAALRTRGVEVTGLSSLPRPEAWAGPWVELARDDEPAPTPAADVTAGGALHWAPLHHTGYGARMARMAAWVAQAGPAAVVVDVSAEVTLLSRLLGVPTVVMAMRGLRDDAPHISAYDAATALVAPWPAGLPEPWWPQRWLTKTHHVGALSRFDEELRTGAPGRAPDPGRALLLWGRGGTWSPDLAELQAALPQYTWHRPAPDDDVWAELTGAGLVVCHAGQNAVAEVAAARRPAVVVADPRPFDEQEHTVASLEAGGLAATATTWPQADAWPALAERALALGGEGWAAWTDGEGAGRAAGAILTVCRADTAVRTASTEETQP